MFNRYWRTYPLWLQVFLLGITIFTLMSFTAYLILAGVPRLIGVAPGDLSKLKITSATPLKRGALLVQSLYTAGLFTAPALLFAAFTHPRLREYLGLRKPGKMIHWLLVTGIMIGFLPFALFSESWMMQHLHLGQWAADTQRQNDQTFEAFFSLSSPGDVIYLFVALAALPAFGEELMFRGVLLRLFHRGFTRRGSLLRAGTPDVQVSMFMPVVSTAIMFAVAHPSPYGFVFIFMAGCILALIYSLTGSLWCSIWAHFLYNGTQILLNFLGQRSQKLHTALENNFIPPVIAVAGLALFLASFYALVKSQTPLPPDWSDDFRMERQEIPTEDNGSIF